MKNKRPYNLIKFNVLLLLFLLILVIVSGVIGIYIITVKLPNGKVGLSNWPQNTTAKVLQQIQVDPHGQVYISDAGKRIINDDGVWLEILDVQGNHLYNKNAPDELIKKYNVYDIMQLSNEKNDDQYIEIKNISIGDKDIICIIGYPIKISQVKMYFNQERFSKGKSMIITVLIIGLILSFIISSIYNLWLAKKNQTIIFAIESILHRSYKKLNPTGTFAEINHSLNILQSQIIERDDIRKKMEQQKEEWIANVTHDLKTPLSPIKGYSELLKETKDFKNEQIQRYGEIIYKNSLYIENLIEEMKLTYQLKNEMVPLNRVETDIVRFIREIIIDILNDPEYEDRDINFYSDRKSILIMVDPYLLKRAISNLIINSLIHNKKYVKIRVEIFVGDKIFIDITDDGSGISEDDLNNLFSRYYRGTNTEMHSAGTGLGLAIAKQIIELNQGILEVKSKLNIGTKFIISFLEND